MQQTNKNFSTRLLKPVRIVTTISSVGLTMLAYLMFFPMQNRGEAASAVTGAATASTTSLTLSSSSNSANIAITPNSIGVFAMSDTTNEAEFNVTTNNYTGYTLSIAADDDDGNLVNNVNDSTVYNIGSISAPIDQSTFDTAAYNNKWGYKPSKYVDANDIVVDNTGDTALFLPSPTTVATVLDRTTEANVVANIYTIGLGARVDQNMVSGTYSKTFSLLATANPIVYIIEYNSNTADTVANMPATQGGDTSITSITLSGNTPSRDSYNFLGWCNAQPIANDGVDSCPGATFQPGAVYGIDQTTANTTTLYAMWKIDAFTQTTEVRYENADGTWGSYSTVDTQTLNYGSSYSWSTAQINNFDSAAYQAASVSSYTVTEAHTNYVSIYRNTFTCTKQYRLEAGNGDWGNYDPDGTIENVRYGSTCSYTKDVDYYTSQTASVDNVTSNQTLSVSLPRTTYSLTVSAGSNTSKPTGSGTYRWGQVVPVSVTKNTDITCTSYSTPTWTATAGTAPAAGASTSFTMPTSNVTITATSTASNVSQTITLSRSGGASGINIGGTNYTGSSVSLTCGTYNISGNYSSGYEFSSWSRSGSVTVANTSSASTTMTVSGPGTLTLNGKSKLYLQNVTAATCSTTAVTVYDSRDEEAYTIQKLADGKCWLLDNLRLDLTNSTVKANLSATNTNASNTTLNYLKNGGGTTSDQYATAGVGVINWGGGSGYTAPKINTASKDTTQSYGSGSVRIGVYYNYCAASAGGFCYGYSITSPGRNTEDICPKGWRMPTGGSSGEYQALYTAYSSNVADFKNALRTSLTGETFYDGHLGNQGYSGSFWASTSPYSGAADTLTVASQKVYPQDTLDRESGYPVRCILK